MHESDSLIFLKQNTVGEIRADIPPKILNNRVYFLTDQRIIISYPLTIGKENKPAVVCKLPAPQPFISDFLVLSDSTLIYASPMNAELVEYNFKQKKHQIKTLLKHNFINPSPFLGAELIKTKKGFLFPYVNREEYEVNCSFFGVYDQNYRHKNSIGNFRAFGRKHFAPFYDSPIISNFRNNQFLISSSSSKGVALYELDTELTGMKLKKMFCFKNKVFGKVMEDLSKKDLGDFNLLNERHVTNSFVMSIKWIKNNFYRITKGKQPMTDQKGMVNSIEMSGWSLENYNVSKNLVTYTKFPPRKYRFTNTLILNNKLFFLSFNNNRIVYYAFS